MCDKHCSSRQRANRPNGISTLRLSDDEALVIESGSTRVTICNGEVQIDSTHPVSFNVEEHTTFRPVAPPQPHRQNISQPCRNTGLQFAQWASPAQEEVKPSAVRETSSTDGEEDIPSS